VRDNEEENIPTEDDGLLQEEETGSQTCVTEDMEQKRKYISAVLCCVLCFVVCCALLCAVLFCALCFVLLTYDCRG
jgi:hypothetical protein